MIFALAQILIHVYKDIKKVAKQDKNSLRAVT